MDLFKAYGWLGNILSILFCYSAFSAFFSDKSAFPCLNVPTIDHKRFRFYEVVDGAPFAQSLVEVTGDAKARTTF